LTNPRPEGILHITIRAKGKQMARNVREQTDRLLEMVDDGNLDPMMALTMCLKWMSEAEVAEMMDANELSERFEEDFE
jgi:hypothetical protein